MKYSGVLMVVACLSIGGCTPATRVIPGPARAPIPVEQVMIYDVPPANAQDVAILHATSHSVFAPGGASATDKVVQQLKVQAAQLGANGVVLQGFSDRQTASLGAGAGSESYGRSSAVGVGASGSFGVFKKTGEALAIFVPARPAP